MGTAQGQGQGGQSGMNGKDPRGRGVPRHPSKPREREGSYTIPPWPQNMVTKRCLAPAKSGALFFTHLKPHFEASFYPTI